MHVSVCLQLRSPIFVHCFYPAGLLLPSRPIVRHPPHSHHSLLRLYPLLSLSFSPRICESFPSSFSLRPNQVSPGSLLLTASEVGFDCAIEFFGLGLGVSSSSSSSVSHSLYHPMASLAQAGFPFWLSSPTLQKLSLFRSFLVCPASSVTCCPWLLSCLSSRRYEYL